MRIFAVLCLAEIGAFVVSKIETIKLELQITVLALAVVAGGLVVGIRAIEFYRNWRDRHKTISPFPRLKRPRD